MKAISLISILTLTACGQDSSPNGRMAMKIECIQKEVYSLKKQNASILDSVGKLNEGLRRMDEAIKKFLHYKVWGFFT
jgi:hypothetical protein